jgi:hypothetical protein
MDEVKERRGAGIDLSGFDQENASAVPQCYLIENQLV